MAISRILVNVIAASTSIGLAGCTTPKKQLMRLETSQVSLRSMQTRAFNTMDEKMALRAVISTLQDIDFHIVDANRAQGLVSAIRISDALRMSVTVRRRNETQLSVRANMEFKGEEIKNPSVYQMFFSFLEKAMFLAAQEVD